MTPDQQIEAEEKAGEMTLETKCFWFCVVLVVGFVLWAVAEHDAAVDAKTPTQESTNE